MVNKIFEDSFNFFVHSINSLNSHKDVIGKTPQSLIRIVDTIAFIAKKESVFDSDLSTIKAELVGIKTEITQLKNQVENATKNSLIFTLEGIIDGLIMEVDVEIKKREEVEKSKKKKEEKTAKKNTKVKVFKSSFHKEVEAEMNLFLSDNDVEIENILQTIDGGVLCLTLIYKEK